MVIYIVRRFFQSLLFILLASLLVFTGVVMWMPTGPQKQYDKMGGQIWIEQRNKGLTSDYPEYAVQQFQKLEKTWKVDNPWPLNFFAWLFDPANTTDLDENGQEVRKGIDLNILGLHIQGSGILTGDLGKSTGTARGLEIGPMIEERAGNSFLLMGVSLVLSILIAVPVGIIGATRKESRLSHVLTFASIAGRSIPPFAFGLTLMLFLAIIPYQLNHTTGWTWMPYLPVGEPFDEGQDGNFVNHLYHLIMPALTLSVIQVVWIARFVRSNMLEVLTQDYIRTAKAKGLSSWRVIYRHAFRNALIPLITIIGLLIPGLISGATIVEQVFSYEGLGMLYYRALGGSFTTSGLNPDIIPPPIGFPLDFPLVMVMTIMLIAVVALANMLADVLYLVADPRVNYS